MKKIHIIPMLASAVTLLTAAGCADDLMVATESGLLQGEVVNAYLDLSVEDLAVSTATRTEEPSSDPETDTEAERRVNNVWVFQYNAAGELVYYTYVAGSNLEKSDDIGATFSDIGNEESTIYVVANTDDAEWVTESNKSSFGTIALLKQQTIPNPDPIYATDLNAEGSTVGIPMSGSISGVVVWEGSRVTVPVTRMFAKLMMKVDVTAQEGYTASLTSVAVGNVPNTCAVGTVFTDDETAGTYSSETKYYPWSFVESQILDADDDGYPYVVYVPENIKGENDNDDASTKYDNAPQNSLNVISYLNLTDDEDAQIVADPHYAVSPGGNVTNNYNVRRNCVYRVSVSISPKDVVTPSANCLIATTNTTIAFYPYCRDEIGHRDDNDEYADANYYDFETHLSGDDEDLTLASVKIIWQTQDCIGDNSAGDLVWLSKVDGDDWMHTKIYVKAKKEGNALIAGYNSKGTIIWSWHIWVTDNKPDDVSKALTYTHYLWDENGIYTDTRVTGYPIMRCNLGALADEPASTSWED
ncbi:MAG: fimbrial protein, partial [Prevotellaceae bacterium]|nr:fimbrial protein [Prevotellaceae bacterium]